MNAIITGLGVGFGLMLSLAIVILVPMFVVILLFSIAHGPIGRVYNIINNSKSVLTKKQIRKVKWWMFFNYKKIKLLDKYLSTGMSIKAAYDKVINSWSSIKIM